MSVSGNYQNRNPYTETFTSLRLPDSNNPPSNMVAAFSRGISVSKGDKNIPPPVNGPSQQEKGKLEHAAKTGKVECATCQNRRYQDGSDDPSVSFQTPTHIDPAVAGAAVMAHEQEHVVNENIKAEQEDRQVVSQSVQLHTSICPECGIVYVSGGVTKTTTAEKQQDDSTDLFVQNYKNVMTKNMGTLFDKKV